MTACRGRRCAVVVRYGTPEWSAGPCRPMSGKRVLGFLVARPLIAVVIAAVVVGVSLLVHTHRQKTPVTGRTEHVALSDAQQTQLGNQQYAKTLREDRADIISSGPQYAEVERVAKRIEAVAGRDKPAFVWRVTLLRKHEANAYCLPGGKIVVYTGILPVTRNDAALATVLGHEVAHATAEHAAERIEREHLTKVAAAIIAGGVNATPVRPRLRAARRRRLTAVQPIAGVRGGPHRPRLHGEGGLRPARGRGVLEADAAGIEGQGAARVRQRSPQRRASDRANPEMAARGRARVHARPRRLTPALPGAEFSGGNRTCVRLGRE